MAQQINVKLKGKKPTNVPSSSGHRDFSLTILEGYLKEDLRAPADPKSEEESRNRKTAKMEVFRGKGDEWKKSTIDGETEEVEVTNRDKEFSASKNDRISVYQINGEWRPLSVSQPEQTTFFLFVPGFPRKAEIEVTLTLDILNDDFNEDEPVGESNKEFNRVEKTIKWDLEDSEEWSSAGYMQKILDAFDNEYVEDNLVFSSGNLRQVEAQIFSRNESELKVAFVSANLNDVQGGIGACPHIRSCAG